MPRSAILRTYGLMGMGIAFMVVIILLYNDHSWVGGSQIAIIILSFLCGCGAGCFAGVDSAVSIYENETKHHDFLLKSLHEKGSH